MSCTNDHCPELEAMHDSGMAVISDHPNTDSEQACILSRNIALIERWAADGK